MSCTDRTVKKADATAIDAFGRRMWRTLLGLTYDMEQFHNQGSIDGDDR